MPLVESTCRASSAHSSASPGASTLLVGTSAGVRGVAGTYALELHAADGALLAR